jgi:two-component system torCAD operon response regulator TorR
MWRVALVDQARQQSRSAHSEEEYVATRFGPWRFDIPKPKLSCDGQPVKLTKAEYEILVALVTDPNRALNRDRLLSLISRRVDAPSDRTIDAPVRRLRNKIEENPKASKYFITLHSEGYLFAVEPS